MLEKGKPDFEAGREWGANNGERHCWTWLT